MEKTIFNVYIEPTGQEQCNKLRNICIENKLPYNNRGGYAFQYIDKYDSFAYSQEMKEFFVLSNKPKGFTKVSETEFMQLLKNYKDETPI